MAKSKEKLQAIELRRSGQSVKEIAKNLGVSPGSVSIWTRDITLSDEQRGYLQARQIESGHQGRIIGAEMNKNKRLNEIASANQWALDTIGELSDRDLLLAGAALYWGEGSKGRQFSFCNSDPKAIKFVKRWLTKILGVQEGDLHVRISINQSHEHRYKQIEDFWVAALDIPRSQFYKPTFIKTTLKKKYENEETYYGVAALGFRKSTSLQYRILGLISALTPG